MSRSGSAAVTQKFFCFPFLSPLVLLLLSLCLLRPSDGPGCRRGCNGDGGASGGGGPDLAARAQRAAHFSCAAGAKILPRGHQNTNFSMKKRDQTCPRKVAFRGASRCSSRRALVSSPLCCGLLLLCCCCCTGCCCARASKAAAVHSARATRLEMSHEHCRHVRACSQALRFCSAR